MPQSALLAEPTLPAWLAELTIGNVGVTHAEDAANTAQCSRPPLLDVLGEGGGRIVVRDVLRTGETGWLPVEAARPRPTIGRPRMVSDPFLLPGRLLRRPGPPKIVEAFPGVQVDDLRLGQVLSADAKLLCLYEGTLHAEGPIWDPARGLLFWSDVPNRRLLALHPDGHVEAALDGTYFMNGNALDADGRLVHCEHGRRCISRSDVSGQQPEPIVTNYRGRV